MNMSFDNVSRLLTQQKSAAESLLQPIDSGEQVATANSLRVASTFQNPLKYTLGDIGNALTWKKRVKPNTVTAQNDDFQIQKDNTSPALLCFLMVLYFTGYSFQYYIFNLFLTKLSGNKFVNAAIFGGAEALSVLFSGYLMALLSDISVFRIIFVAGMLCYLVLIFLPNVSTAVIYISNCVFVGSMGGW